MKNEAFYKRIQVPKKDRNAPIMFSSYWPIYFIGNLLVISLVPFMGRYNRAILSYPDYYHGLRISAVIVLILNIIFSWFIDIRPYFDKRRGFLWRGCFTVTGKASSFGCKYLTLEPGIGHKIKVRGEFYYSVQYADRIFLERSYLGDIIKIKRISGFRERIKKIKKREVLQEMD